MSTVLVDAVLENGHKNVRACEEFIVKIFTLQGRWGVFLGFMHYVC